MVVSRSRPLAAVAGDNTIDVKKERRREPRREVRRGRQKPERCVGGLKRRNLNDALAARRAEGRDARPDPGPGGGGRVMLPCPTVPREGQSGSWQNWIRKAMPALAPQWRDQLWS